MATKKEITIEYLRATAERSLNIYAKSYNEADNIMRYYTDKPWSDEELAELQENRIPAKRTNLILQLCNIIVGEISNEVNTVRVTPQQMEDTPLAEILNDLVNYIFRKTAWDTTVGQDMISQALLTGLVCIQRVPYDTGKKDQFGRPIYDISIENVSYKDVILDPASRKANYSDARYIHRRIWMTKEEMVENFPDVDISSISSGGDSIGIDFSLTNRFTTDQLRNFGNFEDLYSVVHSCIESEDKDEDGNNIVYSIYWCHDKELERKEITYNEVKFPYLVYKIQDEILESEFYGVFRGMDELNRAINLADISQLRRINTQKKFYSEGALEDDEQTTETSLHAPGKSLIRVKDHTRIVDAIRTNEVQEQQHIKDDSAKIAERQLGINPAFLGLGFASDSGRKLEIQRGATITALSKPKRRIQQVYRELARDIIKYIGQYYTFNQAYKLVESTTVSRWIEINAPAMVAVRDEQGNPLFNEKGEPVLNYVFEQVRNPEDNEPMVDEDGNAVMAPISTYGSEIKAFDGDIVVDTTVYDSEKESNLQLALGLMNSNHSGYIQSFAPDLYLLTLAQLFRSFKNVEAIKIAETYEATAERIRQQQGGGDNGDN